MVFPSQCYWSAPAPALALAETEMALYSHGCLVGQSVVINLSGDPSTAPLSPIKVSDMLSGTPGDQIQAILKGFEQLTTFGEI